MFGVDFGHQHGMKAAVVLTGQLLVFFVKAWAQQDQTHVKELSGGVAYLIPRTQGSFQKVEWRFGKDLKIAIHESGEKVRYPNGPYKGRLKLFSNNTLRMDHLRKADSNTYWVYMEDSAGTEHTESIQLQVYDAVPKPTINFVVDESNPESCRVTVNCSVGLMDVTYEWLPPKRIASNNGSELFLTFSPLMEVYTCVAKNPISSNSSRLIHRHPCSWEAESSAATTSTKTSVLVSLGCLLLLLLTPPS
ncbi:SLAM family member 8-like isoform X2 [Tympanuchus pallidicinctus]|uniref:SLAM family member 8-like isoform X2 n=1 Tax=Tympanuchus pallidicinctus TaxID=109042 RepID=UPI0022870330|nr:SLAM family member 8-like isoform X2 [Tympanuchus pallidicinctus]